MAANANGERIGEMNENAIDSLISMGRRQSELKSTIEGQISVLKNGNFQWEDSRRICRHCNVETPNLNQYESHRKGKKHLKVTWRIQCSSDSCEFRSTGQIIIMIRVLQAGK